MNWILRAATAVLAITLASCGGGADRTKAQVRLVNASDYASLDLRVHDENRQGAVTYANTPSYVEVDPGKADTQITVAGSTTSLLSFTPSVSEKKHYTVLAYGAVGALKQVTLDEDQGAPDTNKALLRVINAAPDAGALDVFLTASGDPLNTAVATQGNAAFGTLNGFLTLDSRTYQLRVTAANNRADVRLDVSGLVLGSKQIATLVLSSSRGGVMVNALLVGQQGSITRLDGAHARVRAVAGIAGATVSANFAGSVDLLRDIASPAVGTYALVPAGTQPLVVSVNGTAQAPISKVLAAGADYTVLVYGTTAAPATSVLDDDNHLPTDSTQARVRLVNGVSGLTNNATLTVDATPIGTGVAAGSASLAYATITGTSTADVLVSSPGGGAGGSGVLYSDVDRTFLAGSTYSVFVLGASTAPTGVLRRDR